MSRERKTERLHIRITPSLMREIQEASERQSESAEVNGSIVDPTVTRFVTEAILEKLDRHA